MKDFTAASRIRFRLHARRVGPTFLSIAIALSATLPGCLAGGGGSRSGPQEQAVLKSLEADPWADPARVVAEVNGKPITQGEFYRRILRQLGTAKALTGVISQEIVLQEASKLGLKVESGEIERKLDDIFAEEERQAGGRASLLRQYEDAGLTLDAVREDRRSEVETQVLLTKVVKSMRKVDDEVLREYYKATYAKARYATRHIAYSFRPDPGKPDDDANRLRLEAHNKAERAADRIRKGADFSSLARAESDDTVTASRGGDLGAIQEDSKMVPDFMRVVFKLGVNGVSDPVENPNGGYHIFQVTAILPGESFVDCKDKMRRELIEAEPSLDEVRSALLALRKQANARVLVPEAGKQPAAVPSSVVPAHARVEKGTGR